MISESSSEDEIIAYGILIVRRPRIFRHRTNPFDVYDEIDFKSRFRFNKDTVHFLYEHIKPSLKTITERNKPICPMQQMPYVDKILKVTSHIAKLKPMFINMPQQQAINTIKREFYEIGLFPNVIGTIVCTNVLRVGIMQNYLEIENDMEELASFMGHTLGIHRSTYRLPDDVYQTAKISKLFILMEKGQAGEFKGKSLDDINLNMEENLLENSEKTNTQMDENLAIDDIGNECPNTIESNENQINTTENVTSAQKKTVNKRKGF
ncbi:hypothetical protein MML48_9g00015774 [Holotrichia oblita]|uniref:Uncharacterized protein n=1 Tax=Holotrichia oblita TaxID=644536 RepID=A0ACB9SQR2_HOLOL|nr:hypothetical protein MML48_9g00015774 [Holotrichia oblita]